MDSGCGVGSTAAFLPQELRLYLSSVRWRLTANTLYGTAARNPTAYRFTGTSGSGGDYYTWGFLAYGPLAPQTFFLRLTP